MRASESRLADWTKKWREFFKRGVTDAKPITFLHSIENRSMVVLIAFLTTKAGLKCPCDKKITSFFS